MEASRAFVLHAAFAIALAGCTRASEPQRHTTTSASSREQATLAPPRASAEAPAAIAPATDAGGSRAVTLARSIGNTSVVFKLTFEGGEKAAFKPRCRRGRDRYKGEIASYRLAKALGLSSVPEARFERLSVAALEAALAGHAGSLELARKELVADADGTVAGAVIPWINDLEFMTLESEPYRSRWRTWLFEPAPVPDGDRALAAQIATMIVFDSLTGNWDRWSGANIGTKGKSTELLFVDNDGAFMVPLPAPYERQRELAKQLKKYPRALLEKLRALDVAAAKAAFGDENPGTPLLSDAALAGFDERRQRVLGEAAARVRELGEPKVLVFE